MPCRWLATEQIAERKSYARASLTRLWLTPIARYQYQHNYSVVMSLLATLGGWLGSSLKPNHLSQVNLLKYLILIKEQFYVTLFLRKIKS